MERKILNKITDKGITFDQIWEIVDSTPRPELKKSFPDDSHFQSGKYFAKIITDSLLRSRKIEREGNKFIRPDLKKKEEKK